MAYTQEYDKMFCVAGKKYTVKKLILKSIGIAESDLNPGAYRFEQAFWDRYLKDKPEWNKWKPEVVSASYGIGQIMLPTAVSLGLTEGGDMIKVAESLYDPMTNIMLYAKLVRMLLDKSIRNRYTDKYYWLSNLAICLSQYNGGSRGNPDEDGSLRNKKYVSRVMKIYNEVKRFERECED